MAGLLRLLPYMVSTGTGGSNGSDSLRNPGLEENVKDEGPVLKIDLNGSDPDNNGCYESVSAKVFVEDGDGADTLNKTRFYNSDASEDGFLDKVYINNFAGGFSEDGSYLGKAYLTSFETYDFQNPGQDGYSIGYRTHISGKNSAGQEILDKGSRNSLTKYQARNEFGESAVARVNTLMDVARNFKSSDTTNLKNFVGNDFQRHMVVK